MVTGSLNVTVLTVVVPSAAAVSPMVIEEKPSERNPISTDITASDLVLDAAGVIAASGNLLDTAVGNLEADADAGGIFVSNTGALTVGGIAGFSSGSGGDGTNALDATGDVELTATTTITVNNDLPVYTNISNSSPTSGGASEGDTVSITATFTAAGW